MTHAPTGRSQTPVLPRVGDTVTIRAGRLDGRSGVVTWTGRDGSCGCRSLIVRTDDGEWFGKMSEVTW